MSIQSEAGLAPVTAAAVPSGTFAAPETYTKGLVMAGTAMFLYALMDACAKGLAGAIDPLQILLIRCLFALVLGLAMTAARGQTLREVLRTRQPVLQITRGLCAIACMYCAVLAVGMMSLAEALTIIYAAPIAVTLLAIPLLGEQVGIRRLSAVLVGFAGVLVVAGPNGGELNYGLPVALGRHAVLCALSTVITRRLGRTDRGLTTHFYTQFCFLCVSLPMMPFVWVTPSIPEASVLICAGSLRSGGNLSPHRSPPGGPSGRCCADGLHGHPVGISLGNADLERNADPQRPGSAS